MDYYPTISVQETKNNKEINLDLNKKLVRFTTYLKNISTTPNTHTQQNNGIYNTCHGLLSQAWIDGRLIPALICNVNQSNKQYITLIQGGISIKSYQVGCKDQNRNIPGITQLNILEQKKPSINKSPTLETSDMPQN